jgi:hypothetical protein
MTIAERAALEGICGLAGANRVRFTRHAEERMCQRRISASDVYCALRTATGCRAQKDGDWKVRGLDRTGDELTAIVVLEDEVVVVTVF